MYYRALMIAIALFLVGNGLSGYHRWGGAFWALSTLLGGVLLGYWLWNVMAFFRERREFAEALGIEADQLPEKMVVRLSEAKITTPFSDEQVKALNAYQHHAPMHPFTCVNRDDHPDEGILVAVRAGWWCRHCDYTQTWAWEFMADTSWWDPARRKRAGL